MYKRQIRRFPPCGQEKIMRHGCGLDLEGVFSHARPMAIDSDLLKKFSEYQPSTGGTTEQEIIEARY